MKTRYVLLFAALLGAFGALFLAADMYWRVRDAERSVSLSAPDFVRIGMVHVLGLLSLVFLFLALFLLIVSALKDSVFAARIENQPPPEPPVQAAPVVEPIESGNPIPEPATQLQSEPAILENEATPAPVAIEEIEEEPLQQP